MTNRNKTFGLERYGFLVLAILIIAGCRSGKSPDPEPEPDQKVAHAIHNQQLRAVMQSMNRLGFDELPQELEPQEEWEREKLRIRRRLEALAKAAAAIPNILTDVDLSPDQSARFSQLALALQRESIEFSQAATALDQNEMSTRFTKLQQRCHDCHRRYRVLPRLNTIPSETLKENTGPDRHQI